MLLYLGVMILSNLYLAIGYLLFISGSVASIAFLLYRHHVMKRYYHLLMTHTRYLRAYYMEPITPALNVVYSALAVPTKPLTYEIWQYEQYSLQVEHIRKATNGYTTERWDKLIDDIENSWFMTKQYILRRIRHMTQPMGMVSPDALIVNQQQHKLAWDKLPVGKIDVTVGLSYDDQVLLFRPVHQVQHSQALTSI